MPSRERLFLLLSESLTFSSSTLFAFLSVLVLHETLLVNVLMYGSETVLWKEKKKSRMRAVEMDNRRGLL